MYSPFRPKVRNRQSVWTVSPVTSTSMQWRLAAETEPLYANVTLGGGGDASSPPERLPAGLARKQQLREVEVMDAPLACPAQVAKRMSTIAGGSFSGDGEEVSPPPPH